MLAQLYEININLQKYILCCTLKNIFGYHFFTTDYCACNFTLHFMISCTVLVEVHSSTMFGYITTWTDKTIHIIKYSSYML